VGDRLSADFHFELEGFLTSIVEEREPSEPAATVAEMAAYLGGQLSDEAAARMEAMAARDNYVWQQMRRVWEVTEAMRDGRRKRPSSPTDNPLEFEILRAISDLTVATPSSQTRLIGRETELNALGRMLRSGSRWITLTGPGGIGKTSIIRNLGSAVRDVFPDGIWMIECAGISSSDEFLRALSEAAELDPADDTMKSLRSALAEKQTLLILDRMDDLAGSGRELTELLPACPRLAVVATSRTALKIPLETEYPLNPLSLDRDEAATSLFVEVAEQVAPGFRVTSQNRGQVANLCRLAMGVPLSIAIAAACLAQKSLPELVKEIGRTSAVLEAEATPLARTIAHSFMLLSQQDRQVVQCLKAFAGSFSLDDALNVTRGDALETSDSLAHLFRCRLIEVEATVQGVWYRLHDSVRDYLEILPSDRWTQTQAMAAEIRHAGVLAQKAQQIGRWMKEGRWDAGIQELLRRSADLRRGLSFSREERNWTQIRRYADGLAITYFEAGYLSDFDELAEAARLASYELGDLALDIRILGLEGALTSRRGDDEGCRRLWERRLALAEQVGDVDSAVDALTDLAWMAYEHGDPDRAAELLGRAQDLAEAGDLYHHVATAQVIRARMAVDSGDTEGGRAWIARTLETMERVDKRHSTLFITQNIILAHLGMHEEDEAERWLRRLLANTFEGRHIVHMSWTLRQLGAIGQRRGEVDLPARCFTAALRMSEGYSGKQRRRAQKALEGFLDVSGAEEALRRCEGASWESLVETVLRTGIA